MNILVLDKDLQKNVQYYVDKHVVKMTLETTQILSNVFYYTNEPELAPYKPANINHPCCVWARSSLSNWIWLKHLGLELCKEYTYRYYRHHACENLIKQMPNPKLDDIGVTKFPLVMPEIYKESSIVQSYRNYYNGDKQHLFVWTGRETPYWIVMVVKVLKYYRLE